MKIGLFTDPHLGLQRAAHTTARSAAALRDTLFERTSEVIDDLNSKGVDQIYCLGDLFDTFSNTEEVIIQGAQVLSKINGCLAGNHDSSNRVDAVSSLALLESIVTPRLDCAAGVVANPCPGEPYFTVMMLDGLNIVGVPHAMTQSIFCASLDAALKIQRNDGVRNILFLHCNVGVPGYAEETNDGTTLYLTNEYQHQLLEKYDRIFVGHEHVPRSYHQGRLIVLGNVFPISFGEIADRYSYTYDSVTDEVTQHTIFSCNDHVGKVTVEELLDSAGELPDGSLLVSVSGDVKHTEYADLARALVAFWKNNPQMLMCKNDARMVDVSKVKHANSFVPKTLPEMVAESIGSTPYRAEYEEAVAAAEGEAV